MQPVDTYITEAVIKIQMVDVIVPLSVLQKYMQLVRPFMSNKTSQDDSSASGKNISPPFIGVTNLRNEMLPLIYLEFKGLRLMLPVASELIQEFQHDLLMLQVK